jgi:hypothetical protein
VAGNYPVPGYSHLATARPQGANLAAGQVDVREVNATLLRVLDAVGAALGKTVVIFSGYRTSQYSASVGGFAGDPHTRGIAADATIDGRPIGSYPGAVALIHRFGARSGATDFSYKGSPDPAHVDLVTSTGAVSNAAAATKSSIDSPDTFWYAVETKLGLPHTRSTHDFLVAWSQVEGTKAQYNPLATTLRQPGSTSFNSVGVQNYPTPEAGVQATADTLKGYPAVLAVLRGKASAFGNGALNSDLNKWVTGRSGNTQATPYVASLLRNYQGNPSGKSAADWFSGTGGIGSVAHAVAAPFEAVMSVGQFLGKLTDPSYILRGLQVVAGAVLVLVGIGLLVRQVALAADLPDPVSLAASAASKGVVPIE